MLSCVELSWGVLVWLVTRSLREWTLLVKLRAGVGQVLTCRVETLLVGPHNHRDLQHPCKELDTALCVCNPSTGKAETGGPWGLLASQDSQTKELQVQ